MTFNTFLPVLTDTKRDELVTCDPNHLLDTLISKLRLKNDTSLSRLLEIPPSVISKMRHSRLPVGASLLIRMYEVSNLSIRELRSLMGIAARKFRVSGQALQTKE